MTSGVRSRSTFLRDAVLATTVYAVVLSPYLDAGPDVLRPIGFPLVLPLLFLYIVTGGETEGPYGPSTVQVAAYVVALGVLTAAVASATRRHVDLDDTGTLGFVVAATLASLGTVLVLLGGFGLVWLPAGVAVGGLLVAAALAVARAV